MGKRELVKWTPFALALILYVGNESCASFTPLDNYLLACGSSRDIYFQGKTFIPDSLHSKLEMETTKSVAVSYPGPSSVYLSSRIFWDRASYKFRIEQRGWHWIRLYFNPPPYLKDQNLEFASITVVTNKFVLLNNFTFMSYNTYLFKEYAINVASTELSLTFIPSRNSVVFVNAIEVVSIPDEIFSSQPLALNPTAPFNGLSKFALETSYRLNVGVLSLGAEDDILGRNWENDEKYFTSHSIPLNVSVNTSVIKYLAPVTPETAPAQVYATAKAKGDGQGSNLSWIFSVNPNFRYFVRVHFCDIMSKSINILVFNVFINDGIALGSFDISSLTGALAVPYYKDFLSTASADSNTLTISVGSDTFADSTNAILNGLEIMKISNELGSLDGFSSVESFLTKKYGRKLAIIVGSSVSASTFFLLIGLCYCSSIVHRSKTSSVFSLKFIKHFTFLEIQEATKNFDQSLLIGEGGFGKVYKGELEHGVKVAIKVANRESRQGQNEFQNEIDFLSVLSHQNLVSLIGYCNEGSKMILVYEYIANGSLSSHLYGTDLVPLSWKKRLEICIGAAKGLHYLHTGAAQSIIHRDVKTTNILLDNNLVAKVADFGISRKGPSSLDKSHVTTTVKGSFGYFDPEYFRTKHLTEKSDVYSFGVVLMEVICGKSALDDSRPTEQINLAGWALSCQEKGTFHDIVDPSLDGKVNLDSLNKVFELAWKCLKEQRVKRPSMGYVLCELENALHLELASPSGHGFVDPVLDGDVENGI